MIAHIFNAMKETPAGEGDREKASWAESAFHY